MSNIVLQDEQITVYNRLHQFLKDDKTSEIILIGYAGTGKTTMITKFLNDVITNNIINKIVIAAPTHKAVNIVKSKLFDSFEDDRLLHKINIMTVHRLLNYQSYIDSYGKKYFATSQNLPNWKIYKLIIIDECSMLSDQIIDDITSTLNKTKNNIKIIYIGDPAQLPPVSQNNSKIFTKNIEKLYLKNILRTDNNNIMELSNAHRKWIFGDKITDLPHIDDFICEKIRLYSSETNMKEIYNWLEKFINLTNTIENENETYNNNIILTWTNKKCNYYNQYIRQKIFNKKELNKYEIGEILIFNDFHRISINDEINDEKINISFYTSEQIKLLAIEELDYKISEIKIINDKDLPIAIQNKIKNKIKSINELLIEPLKIFSMGIKKISNNIQDEPNQQIFNILSIHPTSELKYKNIIDNFEDIIQKLRTSCYKILDKTENKDNMKQSEIQCRIDRKINQIWKNWQASVIDIFAQLNYGYAITVHKSQGSTFKNVFIDISDILNNLNTDEVAKCLYTSITRASDTLNLLI
jgi:hypothetical protein